MQRAFCAVVAICVFALMVTTAEARPRHHRIHKDHHVANDASDPRPSRWCMWWLRRYLSIPKSAFPNYSYNLARAGRYIGSAASGPGVGVVVVWNHHIGIITGRTSSGWIVKSGNDGHAVRERERSLRGVIAYRWPSGGGYAMRGPKQEI